MKEQYTVSLQAEPSPLEVDLRRMAILVIDMQNAFASKGGMFDLWGFNLSNIPGVVENIKNTINMARIKGIKIIYIAHRLSTDLREVGPMSPFYGVNRMFDSYQNNPEVRDKLLLSGTWGSEIIDELQPKATEIVIEKRRYSAFAGTDLDITLRTYDIKYLIFTGVTTNVCVESSIRDAHHLEYSPILITDASAASPPSRHESTIDNVKQVFGWVTNCNSIMKILR
jgi:ureidoacrylate peracid hydrolase